MAEQVYWPRLIRAGWACLGMLCSTASAVELGEMEIRSQAGMPLIAHVQFEMTPEEVQQPEKVSITLRSSSIPDFKGLVRTRVFLQPNSTSGFLRLTSIEPAPKGLSLVLEARDPRQPHVREYVIEDTTARSRDVQRPEPTRAVTPPQVVTQPAAPARTKPADIADVAPRDGIELRLLDQTEGRDPVSPRALASDLELLNKTQAELLKDETARKQAAQALNLLGAFAKEGRGLLDVKASREVVRAAMDGEEQTQPDSFVLTIQDKQVSEESAKTAEPAPQAPQLEPVPPQHQSLPPAQEPAQAPVTSSTVPVQNSPELPVTAADLQEEEAGWGEEFWLAAAGALMAIALGGWAVGRARARAAETRQQSAGWASAPQTVVPAVTAVPAAMTETRESPVPSPLLLEDQALETQTPARPDDLKFGPEPDFDSVQDPASGPDFALEPERAVASVSEQFEFEAEAASLPISPEQAIEPPFKNENDARIELAGAYLEIEDFEAAAQVLASLEGELTEPQKQQLEHIREEIMQGEERS